MMIQPPTTRLPPIAKIAEFTTTKLAESVGYLEALYRPLVRGSRRRRDTESYPSCDHHDHHDDDTRFDAFERTYAIRWLTALISQLDTISQALSSHDHDHLIQRAASLLATCAGVAASGRVHRQFAFQLSLPSSLACVDSVSCSPSLSPAALNGAMPIPIHITLTDIPLDNDNYASVGAQTWGAACVLAEMIAQRPDRFGLGPARLGLQPPHPLRILELGAGTGLVGLTIAKVLQALLSLESTTRHHDTQPTTTIVLTDFYPAVLANLQSNIDANFCPTTPDDPDESSVHHAHTHADTTIRVISHPLDWSSFSMAKTRTSPNFSSLLSTPFDLVFGADVIYETQHAVWIRDCLESLLAHPHTHLGDGANETSAFHLVIPQRPTHTFELSTVEEVFGRTEARRELVILEKESIVCEAYGDGRRCADEDVEYVYYRIGWSH